MRNGKNMDNTAVSGEKALISVAGNVTLRQYFRAAGIVQEAIIDLDRGEP